MIEFVRPGELIYRLSDSNGCDEYYLFFTPPLRGEYLKTDKTNWDLAVNGSLHFVGWLEDNEFYASRDREVYIFRSNNPSLLFSTPEGAPFGWVRRFGEYYYYFMIMPMLLGRLKLFVKDNDEIILFEEWKGQLEVSRRNDPGYGWWELRPPKGGSGEDDDGGETWLMTGGGGFIVAERGDEVKWL
jgi:hypothetical protein